MDFKHIPVLLREVIETLDVKTGGKYIDATLGGGGYTREVLERGGVVLGIDLDQEAIDFVKKNSKFEIRDSKLFLTRGNFRDIGKIAKDAGFGEVDGVVFDLGMSSYQIEGSGRGFSFMRDEPLDMRMGTGNGMEERFKASDVVNNYSFEDLTELFLRGEEHDAERIARGIVDRRKVQRIETTEDLVSIVRGVKKAPSVVHPATKVFQAIRMEVNQELQNLRLALPAAFELLRKDGRLAVVSFHSLEDRVVKQFIEGCFRGKSGEFVQKKPITATFDEINSNSRARSAKLRSIKKI